MTKDELRRERESKQVLSVWNGMTAEQKKTPVDYAYLVEQTGLSEPRLRTIIQEIRENEKL